MKKIIIRILALSLLAATVTACAVSCKKNDVSTDSESGSESNDVVSSEDSGDVSDPNTNDSLDAPENLNFNGKTFTISYTAQSVADGEFTQETVTGSPISKAVYERNELMKTKFGAIVASEKLGSEWQTVNRLEQMAMGGASETDIAVGASYQMVGASFKGYLADLRQHEGIINFEKDWYSQGYNDALSIGEKQYLIGGKMSLTYYRYMMGILFNMDLFDVKQIDYPFELVKNKQWTFEKMAELATNFYSDGGEGIRDKDDTYGYYVRVGTGTSMTDGFMSACNLRVIGKDESNYYKLDMNTERYSTAVDNVFTLLKSSGTFASTAISDEDVARHFANGGAAMVTLRMFNIEGEEIREMKNKGVLPYPMADEEQDSYYTYVQDRCALFGIPTVYTDSELENNCQFLEVYGWASYHKVKPAYYETMLTSRYVDDPDSVKMIELMDENVYVDPVNIYNSGTDSFNAFSTVSPFRGLWASGNNTISSLIASNVTKGQLQGQADKLNGYFKELAARG